MISKHFPRLILGVGALMLATMALVGAGAATTRADDDSEPTPEVTLETVVGAVTIWSSDFSLEEGETSIEVTAGTSAFVSIMTTSFYLDAGDVLVIEMTDSGLIAWVPGSPVTVWSGGTPYELESDGVLTILPEPAYEE